MRNEGIKTTQAMVVYSPVEAGSKVGVFHQQPN